MLNHKISLSPQAVSDNQIVISHSDDEFSVITFSQTTVNLINGDVHQIECVVMESLKSDLKTTA